MKKIPEQLKSLDRLELEELKMAIEDMLDKDLKKHDKINKQ